MNLRCIALGLCLLVVGVPAFPAAAQTVATKRVMRDKLSHAQKVLEAILTSDFKSLEDHTVKLTELTKTEGWAVLRSPEYQRQSADFTKALTALLAAARERDLDRAATEYMSMATTCFACHRYLKNSRIARIRE